MMLTISASLVSCDDVTGSQDNPVVPTPTPTPTPSPTYASDEERPLTFEAAVDGVKVTLKFASGATPDYKKVEYSLDQGATWTALKSPNQAIILEKAGDMVMFRGDNDTYNGDAQFVTELVNANARTRTWTEQAMGGMVDMVGSIYGFLFGNVMSLIQNKDFANLKKLVKDNQAAFKNLFKDAIIDAQNANGTKKLVLPAIGQEVVIDAFKGMFEGSTIQNAPKVVAEMLGYGTIADMFKDCEDLKNVFLSLGYLAEGTTPGQAMGGVLGGITGTAVVGNAGTNAGRRPNVIWAPPPTSLDEGGRLLSLDDVMNASGIAEDVLKNTTITMVNAETGMESHPVDYVPLLSIKIQNSSFEDITTLSVTEGDNFKLEGVMALPFATDQSLTWSLSNSETVEFISPSEKIRELAFEVTFKALKAGVVTITASHGELKASVEVTVNPKEPETIAVTGVTLDQKTLSLETGGTATLTATIAPEGATNQDVTWSSSNEEVATVDKDGKVTAVAAGEATITVTTKDGEFTASCKVTVTKKEEDEPEPENPVIDATDDFVDGGDPLK